MATLPYIRLANSNSSLDKRFKVLQGSYRPSTTKTQSRRRTLTGKADTQEGAHVGGYLFTVKVRNLATGTDPDGATYGVLADLDTLFALKNPNGVPSNTLFFIDFLGVSRFVHLIGQMEKDFITPYHDGNNSWVYVNLAVEVVASL